MEMKRGLQKVHGVIEVGNPIGNHIPMTWKGHDDPKKRFHVGEDSGESEEHQRTGGEISCDQPGREQH